MKKQMLGIILLVVMVGGGVAYQRFFYQAATLTLKGYVGGEKIDFLENPAVKKILQKKYGLTLNAIKAGSIEMVKEQPASDIDFLWPSSQVALELYKLNHHPLVKSEIMLNSPIVLYTWQPIVAQLEALKLVELEDKTYYLIRFKDFLQYILDGKKWEDIGLKALFGKIAIATTDPTQSNSGNMFAGLLANVLAGDVVDAAGIQAQLPILKQVFARLGYMPPSSRDLFQQYLTKGIGDKPIIAGYENQAVEFSLQNKDLWPKVKEKIRILYPKPTVWSSHPLIVVQDRANPLIAALQDRELQQIAWEQHGFRSGLAGIQNDPTVLDVAGIPENITYVIPMPSPQVMETIISALQN